MSMDVLFLGGPMTISAAGDLSFWLELVLAISGGL